MPHNPAFAGYATRVSFNLSLTRSQVYYLWQIKERAVSYYTRDEDPEGAPERPRHDIFVPTARWLVEKGLVEHHKDWCPQDPPGVFPYVLTEAGEHIYALLKIAGLIQVVQPQAVAA